MKDPYVTPERMMKPETHAEWTNCGPETLEAIRVECQKFHDELNQAANEIALQLIAGDIPECAARCLFWREMIALKFQEKENA